MAKVPFRNYNLNQELAAGSEVQFGATSVDPMKDVVSDDIKRQSQALIQAGQTIQKLDDELNDAEAKSLYNEGHYEVEAVANQYAQLKGVDAVATIQTEGEQQISILDDYNNNKLKSILEAGSAKASNGVVKYMYERMMSTSIKSAQNKMITHSLKEQRKYLENETDKKIDLHKNKAMNNYKDWRNPSGDFNVNRLAAHEELKKQAVLKGWNLDPNAVNSEGKKIGISAQYLNEKSKLDLEIAKDVIKKLNEDKDSKGVKEFIQSLKPITNEKTYNEISSGIEQKHENFKKENCVNATIANIGNQNNGDFLTQTNKLMCLSTNHAYEDGKGAVVTDGFHSDQVDTSEKKTTENIETLQQERDTSKFYSVDSAQANSLIQEHQPTHLYAIQRLGVQKADSLYTKAKSELDIDKTKYKENAVYANKINEKILDNYNKLIIEESNKIYGRFGEGNYAIAIANDLEVIKKGVDYNYKNVNEEPKVDFITGLRPLNDLKEEIKETITDKDTQEHALKDLEVKYENIKNQKTQIYNQNLNDAKRIAFAEPNGWKNLAVNNIEIEDFSESDQEILKKGQPENSDIETVAELIDNPKEVRDNLEQYSHKLAKSDYLELERYAESLKNESKYIEANGNKDLMKDVMYKNGFDWVYKSKFGGNSADFGAIHTEWVDRIDYAQRISNKKLTRQQKVEILTNVLMDKVNLQGTFGFGREKDTLTSTVMPDRLDDLFVKVKVKQEDGSIKTEQIFTSEITKEISIAIMGSLYRRKLPMNQQNIAEEWVKFGRPKTLKEAEEFINANLNYQLAPENLK